MLHVPFGLRHADQAERNDKLPAIIAIFSTQLAIFFTCWRSEK